MVKRSVSLISQDGQQQPQLKRKQRPPTNALNAPRKQPARVRFTDDVDEEECCYVDGAGDDDLETPCKPHSSRKKRSRPHSIDKHNDESAFQERPTLDLVGRELNQFQQWIKRSADEPPVVAGAGAAKRIPDSELQMFRDSRFPRMSSSCPPICPSEGRTSSSSSNHNRESSPLQCDEDQQKQRPRSWEQSSPPRKSVRLNMDKLLSENLASEALSLPLLKSPTCSITKDKATMLGLLAECKGHVVHFFFI